MIYVVGIGNLLVCGSSGADTHTHDFLDRSAFKKPAGMRLLKKHKIYDRLAIRLPILSCMNDNSLCLFSRVCL